MSNRRERFDKDDHYDLPIDDREARRRQEGRWPEVRMDAQEAIRRAGSRGKKRTRLTGLTGKPNVLIAAMLAGMAVLAFVIYMLVNRPVQTPQQAPSSAA